MLALARCAATLELFRTRDFILHGREDRMRRHGMEAAGRLDVWRSDSFIMCAEIENFAADPAWQADRT
jgi:hypothetical protein